MNRELITIREAAERLGVSHQTIREWMIRTDNPLPSIQVGTHRRIVVSMIGEWIVDESHRTAGGTVRRGRE